MRIDHFGQIANKYKCEKMQESIVKKMNDLDQTSDLLEIQLRNIFWIFRNLKQKVQTNKGVKRSSYSHVHINIRCRNGNLLMQSQKHGLAFLFWQTHFFVHFSLYPGVF